MSNWQAVLLEPAKTVLTQVGQFLANVVMVVVLLIIGWAISKLIKNLVVKGLKAIKLDDVSDKFKLSEILEKGGMKYSLSELIGVICYWIGMLITVIIAVNSVGLTMAADLLNRIVLFIPNIVIAIIILIAGMFVATLLNNLVQTAASNAGLSQAKLLGKISEAIVVIFAAAISLEQLGIGAKIIELIIGIILGSLGLGLAIALGLGCRDIVGKYVEDLLDKVKSKK
ncbi:MAG: hypothetical protein C4533_04715 [Candidatus Omnitrophota bacterium]|jgi:hypothetical protein|nr:MAG: hypothetical protein C4533_04715 [Candidatus Omnitrophota bacterium]